MRVMMLGWEFPPNISGGLGTACQGITEGLAHHDVDVLFVMPHVAGNEDARHAEVVGLNEHRAQARGPVSQPRGDSPSSRSLEVLRVDSPLQPYLSAQQYDYRMRRSVDFPLSGVGIESSESDFTGGYGANLNDEVIRYANRLGSLAAERSFDLVHAHDWMTYPAALRIKEETDKPLVCHVHACEHDRNQDQPDERIHAVEQMGLSGADRIVCVSRFTADTLRRHYDVDPRKVRVVHNAVQQNGTAPRDDRAPKRRSDRPVVLFLGRVTSQKGPKYFLEAAALVARKMPNVRFVMSGEGDLLPTMIERAADAGLARNVHFTGFLRGEDVERMYSMADVFVLPSVSEPFGITPLEALTLGVPVIVSRQSGVAEILRAGLKFDYWDVEDLAAKILGLLRHPVLRRQLADAGRREVKRLRWELRAKALVGVYRELVG